MQGRVWICPIKNESWEIIKKHNVYGLSLGKKREYDKLNVGDLLLIYVYKPIGNVVGLCKVTSSPFLNYTPYWGKTKSGGIKFPYRIKVENLVNLIDDYEVTIPLYEVIGHYDEEKGLIIEPYLGSNILFYQINEVRARKLLAIIHNLIAENDQDGT